MRVNTITRMVEKKWTVILVIFEWFATKFASFHVDVVKEDKLQEVIVVDFLENTQRVAQDPVVQNTTDEPSALRYLVAFSSKVSDVASVAKNIKILDTVS